MHCGCGDVEARLEGFIADLEKQLDASEKKSEKYKKALRKILGAGVQGSAEASELRYCISVAANVLAE